MLNNELYVGRRVWNRQSYRKNPKTGKRIPTTNAGDALVTAAVPELRILSDELWGSAKARQAAARQRPRSGRARRPVYLFSGLTRCGECNGGFNVSSRNMLRCFNHVSRAKCTNDRSINRIEVEARVLKALKERLFTEGRLDAVMRGFVDESNRLRRERRATLADRPRELAAINKRSKEILELLLAGFRDEQWKEELARGEARRRELEALMAVAEPAPPALHPSMVEAYKTKVESLIAVLTNGSDVDAEAARAGLRAFIGKIVIPPGDALLVVHGDLGSILSAASGKGGVALSGCGGGI